MFLTSIFQAPSRKSRQTSLFSLSYDASKGIVISQKTNTDRGSAPVGEVCRLRGAQRIDSAVATPIAVDGGSGAECAEDSMMRWEERCGKGRPSDTPRPYFSDIKLLHIVGFAPPLSGASGGSIRGAVRLATCKSCVRTRP